MALLEPVRDACVKKLGADHPQTLITMHSLAWAYLDAGKTAEAVALCEQLRDLCEEARGRPPPHPHLPEKPGRRYLSNGKTAEAIALLEQVAMLVSRSSGPTAQTLITLHSLAGRTGLPARRPRPLPCSSRCATRSDEEARCRPPPHPHDPVQPGQAYQAIGKLGAIAAVVPASRRGHREAAVRRPIRRPDHRRPERLLLFGCSSTTRPKPGGGSGWRW